MPFLKSVEIVADGVDDRSVHPFDVPAISAMLDAGTPLRIDRAVTIFVGDNGSGKSTLLEALAVHQGMNAEGGARGMQFRTTDTAVSPLHRHIRVNRSARRPTWSFFLRAESFFNVANEVDELGPESQKYYGGSLHERSHGEAFIDVLVRQFSPGGLYFLDEPESALSVHGQLQLLVRLHDLVRSGAQFVIATHSPLLMAFPDATRYRFAEAMPEPVDWVDIDTVQVTQDFLAHPHEFLAELFADD